MVVGDGAEYAQGLGYAEEVGLLGFVSIVGKAVDHQVDAVLDEEVLLDDQGGVEYDTVHAAQRRYNFSAVLCRNDGGALVYCGSGIPQHADNDIAERGALLQCPQMSDMKHVEHAI